MTGPRMDFRKLNGDPPGKPPNRIDLELQDGHRVVITIESYVITRGYILSPGDRMGWTYVARDPAIVVEAAATFLSGLGMVAGAAALTRHARELGAPWWVA